MKLALAMIVRAVDEEAPLLADCLASVSGHVDAIFIDLNTPEGVPVSKKVRKVAEQYTKNIRERIWEKNFVKARNECFSQVSEDYDWLLWLDSDDIVDHPELLRRIIQLQPERCDGIYLEYDYAHDEWGNTTVSHYVARMVKNNGSYVWKSSIGDENVSVHETLTERRPGGKSRNDEVKIVHRATQVRAESSLMRNVELLEGMLAAHREQEMIDPRILFYLATHYFDLYRYQEVKQLLVEYLKLSGWDEERCEAHVLLGRILAYEGKLPEARTAFLMALGENVASPHPFIELGQLEYHAKRYQQSIWWLEMAVERPTPTTTMVQRPMENLFRAHLLMAQSMVNMGGPLLESAAKEISKALTLRPTEPDAKEAQELIAAIIKERDDMRAATRMLRTIESDEDKLAFINTLPADLRSSPPIVKAYQELMPPKVWPKRSIAIYCPPGPLGNWGPWRLTEGGISGSEEAVIQLSKRMVALGWSVTVYGTPGHRDGLYDGAEWRNYWELNTKDAFDVFIAWRSPWAFDQEWNARKRYLWMHDVMDEAELSPDRIERLDRVIFVSKYHSEFYPWIPEDKVFVSGNGIDLSTFKPLGKRKRYRMVYQSDHVRGLRLLYEMWPEIKKAIPEATLDVYYGWEGFDSVHRDNPERMAWKQQMIQWAAKLDGVTDHGRINHEQIVQELSTAEILAYPCTFPEVYSITFAKACAAGCQPVTSDYGVLKDYRLPGVRKVHFDTVPTPEQIEQYKERLIESLKEPLLDSGRKELMKAAAVFDWDKTAQGWDMDMQ